MSDNSKTTTDTPPLRLEWRTPAELQENPANWRVHPRTQRQALEGSLAEVGWAGALLYNERTKRLIDGHARKKTPKKLLVNGKVPVLIGSWTEEQEKIILASLDPIANLAGTDSQALKDLLLGLQTENAGLTALFDSMADAAKLDRMPEPETDAEPETDRAEELMAEWGTAAGQIWEIEGRTAVHRLMCGDSTDPAQVQRLLDGEKPFLMVTDPPYGVEYSAAWREEAGLNKRGGKGAVGTVTNDDRASWAAAYALFPGDVAYVWHAGLYAPVVARGLEAAGFEIRSQVIWTKRKYAISRGMMHWAHEPCWVAVRKGKQARWCGGRKQKTVWGDIIDRMAGDAPGTLYAARIDQETVYAFPAEMSTVWELSQDRMVEGGHSTQKPLECMARPIRHHGKLGDGVYEPFGGTGTTLIAAENLGRVAFVMEVSPAYTAVILQRAKAAGMACRLSGEQ